MAGVYIHIPFCRSKCAYCDFYSGPTRGREEAYVDALLGEWNERRGELTEPVSTVYLGGGTPSSLDPRLLDRILSAVAAESAAEVTIEVNPEDVTDGFVSWLGQSPVNRVSMGVQSLDAAELKAVGRRHTPDRAIEAARQLARVTDNLSLDLIFGLPGQDLASWCRSLEGVLALSPAHLSAYLLSYEPGTRLWAMRETGKITEAPEGLAVDMYGALCEATAAAGYEHYEISNYARPGFRSRHNSSYWDLTPYLGLGPGAHSYTLERRSYNPSDLSGYLRAGGHGFGVFEDETDAERFNDLLVTSLRTARGLSLADCGQRRAGVEKTARRYLADGSMELTAEGRLRISESSWLVSDRILVDFIDA